MLTMVFCETSLLKIIRSFHFLTLKSHFSHFNGFTSRASRVFFSIRSIISNRDAFSFSESFKRNFVILSILQIFYLVYQFFSIKSRITIDSKSFRIFIIHHLIIRVYRTNKKPFISFLSYIVICPPFISPFFWKSHLSCIEWFQTIGHKN